MHFGLLRAIGTALADPSMPEGANLVALADSGSSFSSATPSSWLSSHEREPVGFESNPETQSPPRRSTRLFSPTTPGSLDSLHDAIQFEHGMKH